MKKFIFILTAMFVSVSFTSCDCSEELVAGESVYVVKSIEQTANEYVIKMDQPDTVSTLRFSKSENLPELKPGNVIVIDKGNQIRALTDAKSAGEDRFILLLLSGFCLMNGIINILKWITREEKKD